MGGPCPERLLDLHALLDGELEGARREEIERHLDQCLACCRAYNQLVELVTVTRSARPAYDIPPRVEQMARQLILSSPRTRPAGFWEMAIAASVVLVAVLLFTMARAKADFAGYAASVYQRYTAGQISLDVEAEQPELLNGWLEAEFGLPVRLPDYPTAEGQPKPYRLVGARRLEFGGAPVAMLAYEMDHRPICLLLTLTPRGKVSRGEVYRIGNLEFHVTRHGPLRVISWVDKQVHYALVTDLQVDGTASCSVCHGQGLGRPWLQSRSQPFTVGF